MTDVGLGAVGPRLIGVTAGDVVGGVTAIGAGVIGSMTIQPEALAEGAATIAAARESTVK